MAKRSRGKGAPAAEAPPTAPAAAPAVEFQPALPGRLDALLPPAAALTVLLAALLASPPEGALQFPGLISVGRILAALAAVCALAAWRAAPAVALALRAAALLAGTLALAAVCARHDAWHLSPFAHTHPFFTGLPSALPFVLLAAAARAAPRHPDGRASLPALATALAWAAAVLLLPHFSLGTAHAPLATALALVGQPGPATLAGAALLFVFFPVAAGVFALAQAAWTRRPGVPVVASLPPGAARIATAGAPLLAAYHLAAPLLADAPSLPLAATGLLLAGLIALLTAVAADLLTALDATPPDAAPLRRAGRVADFAAPAAILATYWLLQTHAMGASNTDENIYFYMAADLANGRWPYVDYFFAHPPLHVLIPGALFSVFGFSLGLAKSVSVAAASISGLALFATARGSFGRTGAIFTMVAFLFAAELLKASSNMTGVNLTVMWLCLALLASLRGRPRTAGALMGLAACTGFYSMAAVCALLALGAFRDRRFALQQAALFLAVWGGINLIFLIAAGDAFVDGVYRYHGLKAMADPRMVPLTGGGMSAPAALAHNFGVMLEGKPLQKDLYYQTHLWLAAVLAPLAALASFALSRQPARPFVAFLDPRRLWRDGADGHIGIIWLVGLALLIEFSMFRELYSFYFTLLYPAGALCLGYIFHRAATWLWSGARDPAPTAPPAPRRAPLHLGAAAALLALFALWEPWSAHANRVFPDEFEELGKVNPYTWTEPPALPALAPVVRALFWEDSRLKGDMERGYKHFLWTKKRLFHSLPEIADWVREHSAPDETIAGASTSAPIIALMSGRRLAAGEADTNNKRFKSGLLTESDYWTSVCRDRIRLVVATPRSYFTNQRMQTMPTARRWFRAATTIEDPELSYAGTFPFTLYERIGDPPSPDAVCRFEE